MKHHSDALPELLPKQYTNGYALKEALHYIHEPPVDANMIQLAQGSHPAQQRLIFEELVAHQISLLTRRAYIRQIASPAFPSSKVLAKTARSFTFSNDQRTKTCIKRNFKRLKTTSTYATFGTR